jgi:hypothetical protein
MMLTELELANVRFAVPYCVPNRATGSAAAVTGAQSHMVFGQTTHYVLNVDHPAVTINFDLAIATWLFS